MASISDLTVTTNTAGVTLSFSAQGTTTTDETATTTETGGTAAASTTSSATTTTSTASNGGSSSSSSSSSSSEIESETNVTNKDGSVTTTIVYTDGTTKVSTSSPDPSKANMIYSLTHPESAGDAAAKENTKGKSGTLYSGTV